MPTSELELHLGVYRRYEAGAVVHTHAPIATALACVLDELPVVHYQMLALGGPVRVAPYATFGTPELAELTLDALEGRTAALMANHGAIAYRPDLDVAVRAVRAARMGVRAVLARRGDRHPTDPRRRRSSSPFIEAVSGARLRDRRGG